MACNTSQCYMLAPWGVARGTLEEVVQKLPEICVMNVISKIVILVKPIEEGTIYICMYLLVLTLLNNRDVWMECVFGFADVHGVAHTEVTSLSWVGDGEAPEFVIDPTKDGFICPKYELSQLTDTDGVGHGWARLAHFPLSHDTKRDQTYLTYMEHLVRRQNMKFFTLDVHTLRRRGNFGSDCSGTQSVHSAGQWRTGADHGHHA